MPDSNDTLAQFDSVIESAQQALLEQTSGVERTVKGLCAYIVSALDKAIVKEDGEFCVKGKGGKNFGCYPTREKAEARLKQMEQFSKALADTVQLLPHSHVGTSTSLTTDEAAILLEQNLRKMAAGAGAGVTKSMSGDVLAELTQQVAAFLRDSEDVEKAKHGKKSAKGKDDEKEDDKDSKLPPWLRGKSKTKKGLPAEYAEAGIHIHGTERENSKTKRDGPHEHMFMLDHPLDLGPQVGVFPEGTMLWSEADGSHEHVMAAPDANEVDAGGAHFHSIRLPNGSVLETAEDGEHTHELQIVSTAFDGMHVHELELPDGTTVKSMLPGEFWRVVMHETPQEGNPLVPQASMFAALPDHVWEALHMMRSVETLKSAPQNEAVTSGYRSGQLQALKVPDPSHLIDRLGAQNSAGILSMAKRQSRVDQDQVLVNELTPLKFKDAFMWGIVKHAECVEYDSFGAIPADIIEGVDDHSRKEFSKAVGPVFYLPFALVKAFAEPVKLTKPPGGRRFASKVDLAKDAVPVIKCVKCRTSFEAGDSGLHICHACHSTAISKGECNDRHVRILKSVEEGEQRLTFGVVLEPDTTDKQDDRYTVEEVQKAAFGFMENNGGKMKLMHKGETLDGRVIVLETYLSKSVETFGDETYPQGTWFMTSRVIDDMIWSDVKDGTFTGYSIGGSAVRDPLA